MLLGLLLFRVILESAIEGKPIALKVIATKEATYMFSLAMGIANA